jgi:hypothetical protein
MPCASRFQGADYQNGDQVRARVDQLVERLRALPGVTASRAAASCRSAASAR